MKGGLLLDVVVRKSAAILELLSCKDQPLLVRWDPLLVLDLRLHVVDGIRTLHLQSNGLSREGLNEDLHTTTETEDKMKGRFLLDVIVGKGAPVFELLPGEDQPLLVWWDALLVLDFSLHVVDGVGALDLQGDGFAGEGLDEDLHATAETEDEMEGGLLLDVVVGEGAAVLELLSGEDQPLLVWWDPFLVLDLGLDVVDGVGALDLEGDGLSRQGLDEDLHATAETEDEMEGAFLLDVVVGEGAAVLELLSGEDQPLLVWRDSFLVLDLGLDVVDGV